MSAPTFASGQRAAPAAVAPATPLVLAIICTAVFMATLDLFIVNVAFPDIQRDFSGTSLSSLSWVLNGYAIVFAALLVPAGRLADRFGQKRVFLSGLTLFTAASVLCAVATGPEMLIADRVLQAAGAAALMPTSLALLLNAVSADRRPWAIGIWSSVAGIAAGAGPAVGGLLVTLNWRWVFLINLPIGLVAAALAIRVLDEHRDETSTRRPDLLGALVLTAGIAALALGIVEGPNWGWSSARIVGSFAAAALLTVLFVQRSAHHPSPIVEPALVRVRSFAVTTIAALFFNTAFAVMLLALVEFMSGVWGYSALRTGLAISPGPLAMAIVALRVPILARRVGPIRLAVLGSVLFALAGLSWTLRADASHAYLTDLFPGLIVGGIGFGFTLPTLISTATRSLPPQRFATGSAVVTMARQIGAVFGVAILIVILDDAGNDLVGAFHDGWLFMSVMSMLTAAACLVIGPTRSDAAPVTR